MANKCCVKNCDSIFKSKKQGEENPGLFRAPKNPILFKKWQASLDIAGNVLEQNSLVCEKHFQLQDVRKDVVLKDPSTGKVIVHRKLNHKRLLSNAVPSRFEYCTTYNKDKEKRKDGYVLNIQILRIENPSTNCNYTPQPENSSHQPGDKAQLLDTHEWLDSPDSRLDIVHERNKFNLESSTDSSWEGDTMVARFEPGNKAQIVKPPEQLNSVNSRLNSVNTSSVASKKTAAETAVSIIHVIEDLFTVIDTVPLPDAWSIHKIYDKKLNKKVISISKLKPVYGRNELTAVVTEKQIVLQENKPMQIFILNRLTNILGDINPKTLDNLEIVIQTINDVKVCAGGPSIQDYNDVHSKVAHKDISNKWRHNSCNLVVMNGDICVRCLKLHKNLRRIASAANKKRLAPNTCSLSPLAKKRRKKTGETKAGDQENSLNAESNMKVKKTNSEVRNCEVRLLKLSEFLTLQEHYINLLMQKKYSKND